MTAATIQAIATIESLANPIDTLAVLQRQYDELEAQIKALKAQVANEYGEGKHRGEKYGVLVTIANVKQSNGVIHVIDAVMVPSDVDVAALLAG